MTAPSDIEFLKTLGLTVNNENRITAVTPTLAAANAGLVVDTIIRTIQETSTPAPPPEKLVRKRADLVTELQSVTADKCKLKTVPDGVGSYEPHILEFPSNAAPPLPTPMPSWTTRHFQHNPRLKGLWVSGINESAFARFTLGSLKNGDVILRIKRKDGTDYTLDFAGTLDNWFSNKPDMETELTVKRGNASPHKCMLYKTPANESTNLEIDYRREPTGTGNGWRIMRHTDGSSAPGLAQQWGMNPGDIIKSIQSFDPNYGITEPESVPDAQWGPMLAARDFEIKYATSANQKMILHLGKTGLTGLGITIRKEGATATVVADDGAGKFYENGLKKDAVIQSVRRRTAAAGEASSVNTDSVTDWKSVLNSSFYEITYVPAAGPPTKTVQHSTKLGLTILKEGRSVKVVDDVAASGLAHKCRFSATTRGPLKPNDVVSVPGTLIDLDLLYLEGKVKADTFVKFTVIRSGTHQQNVQMPPAPSSTTRKLESKLGIGYWAVPAAHPTMWRLADVTENKPAAFMGLQEDDLIRLVRTGAPSQSIVSFSPSWSDVVDDTFELTYSRPPSSVNDKKIQYSPYFGMAIQLDDDDWVKVVYVKHGGFASNSGLTVNNEIQRTGPAVDLDLFAMKTEVTTGGGVVDMTKRGGGEIKLQPDKTTLEALGIQYRPVPRDQTWRLSAPSEHPASLMGLQEGDLIHSVRIRSSDDSRPVSGIASSDWPAVVSNTFELTYSSLPSGVENKVQYSPFLGMAIKATGGTAKVVGVDHGPSKIASRDGLTNGDTITGPSVNLFDLQSKVQDQDFVELTVTPPDAGGNDKRTLYKHDQEICQKLEIEYRRIDNEWKILTVHNGRAKKWGLQPGDMISWVGSIGSPESREKPKSADWERVLSSPFEITYSTSGTGTPEKKIQHSKLLGMTIRLDGQALQVVDVTPGEWAHKGLNIGESITKIDGAAPDLSKLEAAVGAKGLVKLAVKKSDDQPFQWEHSQLLGVTTTISHDSTALQVVDVTPGEWTDRSKLSRDDSITKIGDSAPGSLSDLENMFRDKEQFEVTVNDKSRTLYRYFPAECQELAIEYRPVQGGDAWKILTVHNGRAKKWGLQPGDMISWVGSIGSPESREKPKSADWERVLSSPFEITYSTSGTGTPEKKIQHSKLLGMTIRLDGQALQVVDVTPGEWAHKGLNIGESITKIDGAAPDLSKLEAAVGAKGLVKLAVKKSDDQPFQWEHSQLLGVTTTISHDSTALQVVDVTPGEWTDRSKLSRDDSITKIGDSAPGSLSDLENMFRDKEQFEVTVNDKSRTLYRYFPAECQELAIEYRPVQGGDAWKILTVHNGRAKKWGLQPGDMISWVGSIGSPESREKPKSADWERVLSSPFEITYSTSGTGTPEKKIQHSKLLGMTIRLDGQALQVVDVTPNEWADRSKLSRDDSITKIGDSAPGSLSDLENMFRDKEQFEVTVNDKSRTLYRYFPAECQELAIEYRPVQGGDAWKILTLDNGKAKQWGLEPGDIIKSVGRVDSAGNVLPQNPKSADWNTVLSSAFEITYPRGIEKRKVQYSPYFGMTINRDDKGGTKVVDVEKGKGKLAHESGFKEHDTITAVHPNESVDLFEMVAEAKRKGFVELKVDGQTQPRRLTIGDAHVTISSSDPEESTVHTKEADGEWSPRFDLAPDVRGKPSPPKGFDVPQGTKISCVNTHETKTKEVWGADVVITWNGKDLIVRDGNVLQT